MNVDTVNSSYSTAQSAAAYTRPVTAPDTSATQPPDSTQPANTDTTQASSPESQSQQVKVYFYDANLGQYVNTLV